MTAHAPRAAIISHTDTRHGVTRTDDYAWLRADNWQEVFKDTSVLDPAIRDYLDAENAYQEAFMSNTEALQQTLFSEMKGRIKEDDESVPAPDGPWAYGTSFKKGGQQPRYYRVARDNIDGDRQILIDGDKESEGKEYFKLGGTDRSPDHTRMLWAYDDKGSEYFTVKIRDLSWGTDLDDTIKDMGGGAVFTADGNGVVYTLMDDNHRPSKVFYHKIGSPASEDILLYEEADSGFFVGVSRSRLDDFIEINCHDHQTSEAHLLDANDPTAGLRVIEPRQVEHEYTISEGGDELFVLTNADGAKDFKIVQAPLAYPGRANWREVVPHEPGRLIISHAAYSGHLVWLERRDALPRIVIKDRATGEEHAIAFDEEAYSLGLQGSAEFDTQVIRFSYSSMTTPSQTFDYNMATRERVLLKTQEVPSGHDPADYLTQRTMAPSHDGTLVPVTLLMRRDTPRDGSAPCLLYGYGSYGITIPAAFNTNCLSLVDRGFVYAIAHIRGGMDKGYGWYEDGKRDKKKNTFEDFVAAANHLVSQSYTSHKAIIAQGGSAGGMLMGAVVNMAPDAFGGIIAEVPFVDVLNTMLDDTLPLTPPEWPEWGNPIEHKHAYDYIASYSPYDNVGDKAYPPILAVGGLTDPRVTYWEPAKWIARLRSVAPEAGPYLLKTNMGAGHGGASGRFSRLEEVAEVYAFALKVTDRTEVA